MKNQYVITKTVHPDIFEGLILLLIGIVQFVCILSLLTSHYISQAVNNDPIFCLTFALSEITASIIIYDGLKLCSRTETVEEIVEMRQVKL